MDVNYGIALLNGFLSFFSPCILPLLPVYFGYLAGEAITNVHNSKIKAKLLMNAFGFVLGITLLNVLLGFGAKAMSDILNQHGNVIRITGGILMILFGVYFITDIKWLFLEKERKIHLKSYTPNFLKSFLLGITFSFGWTPCNGPIIGSILIIASFEQNYLKAGSLMLVYSLGFSVLFLISAFLVGFFVEKVKKIFPYFKWIKRLAGLLMIIMGILLIMNKLNILNS